MKGSVTKRPSGSYLVRISIGRDEKGKRLYHTETLNCTKKEAEKRCRELVAQFELGGVIAESKLSLNAYLAEWLEVAKKPKVSPRTLSDYSRLVGRYVAKGLGRMPLAKVSVLDIQALYSDMSNRGLSGQTIRRLHNVLNQAFKQAVRWRKISFSPAADVELPSRNRKKVIRAFNKAEANQFLDASAETQQGLLFEVALFSGMRPGEYLALTWDCVDWDAGSLRVEKAVCRPRGGAKPYLGPPKTPESRRTIPMPETTMARLRKHRTGQLQQRLLQGERWQDLDLVFPNTVGNFQNERNLSQRYFKAVLEKAGLPKTFRLYDLRHSCATLLLLADENVKVVSERLGHSTVVLTLDTYQHVLPSMQKRATAKLAGLFCKEGTA